MRHLRNHVGFISLLLVFALCPFLQGSSSEAAAEHHLVYFSDGQRMTSTAFSANYGWLDADELKMIHTSKVIHSTTSSEQGAEAAAALRQLMDLADGALPNKPLIHG